MNYFASLLCYNSNVAFSFYFNMFSISNLTFEPNEESMFIKASFFPVIWLLQPLSNTTHFYLLEMLFDKKKTNYLHNFLLLQVKHVVDWQNDNPFECARISCNCDIMVFPCLNNPSRRECYSYKFCTIYLMLLHAIFRHSRIFLFLVSFFLCPCLFQIFHL